MSKYYNIHIYGTGRLNVKLLAGNSNRPLAEAIANKLGIELADARVERFTDNEVFVTINENIRGQDVFVIQSTSAPANDHLMEMLVTIDALRRASAKSITAVIPYYGYARQDRKTGGRTPISAKLIANLITTAGATHLLAMDLHAGQIEGFFDMPTDHLGAYPVFAKDIKREYRDSLTNVTIISPDVGGVVRARNLAGRINAEIAIVDKRRSGPGKSEVMNLIGDVNGRDCIIFDDIIDTGGTLCNAANAIMDAGANSVSAMISHGVLSGSALNRITESRLKELVVTDSIEVSEKLKLCKKLRTVSISEMLAEAIRRIYNQESVSKLLVG